MAAKNSGTARAYPLVQKALAIAEKSNGLVKPAVDEIARQSKCSPSLVSMLLAGLRGPAKAKRGGGK